MLAEGPAAHLYRRAPARRPAKHRLQLWTVKAFGQDNAIDQDIELAGAERFDLRFPVLIAIRKGAIIATKEGASCGCQECGFCNRLAELLEGGGATARSVVPVSALRAQPVGRTDG